VAEFLLPSAVNQGGAYPQGVWGCLLYPLRDTSFTPLGMLPNTLGRHRNTPIGGIGTREELYLHQMNALIGKKGGFSR